VVAAETFAARLRQIPTVLDRAGGARRANGGAFFWCRPPIRNLVRRPVSKSGKLYEEECIKWTPTYLYLTMIELLVPPKG
jgi:hypothetical protein